MINDSFNSLFYFGNISKYRTGPFYINNFHLKFRVGTAVIFRFCVPCGISVLMLVGTMTYFQKRCRLFWLLRSCDVSPDVISSLQYFCIGTNFWMGSVVFILDSGRSSHLSLPPNRLGTFRSLRQQRETRTTTTRSRSTHRTTRAPFIGKQGEPATAHSPSRQATLGRQKGDEGEEGVLREFHISIRFSGRTFELMNGGNDKKYRHTHTHTRVNDINCTRIVNKINQTVLHFVD